MAQRKKILLIDNERDFCFFMKKNLENRRKYQVITTTKGHKGVNLARKEKPDLILLDIVMPQMAGNEVAQALLDNPLTKQIPVIFLTGIVTKEEMGFEEPVKAIAGENFIAKTVGTEKIISFIEEILESKVL